MFSDFSKKLTDPRSVLVLCSVSGYLFCDGLLLSRNRLLPGQGFPMSFDAGMALVLASMIVLFLVILFQRHMMIPVIALTSIGAILYSSGIEAGKALELAGPYARVSTGAGFWVPLSCLMLILIESLFEESYSKKYKLVVMVLAASGFYSLIRFGVLDSLSLVKEYEQLRSKYWDESFRHLWLASGSSLISVLLGVPLAWGASKSPGFRKPLFYVLNLIQTIPGLAMFSLLMTFIGLLIRKYPFLSDLGIGAIGWTPAFIALVFYGLFSVVRTSFAAFDSLQPEHLLAARGVGMSPFESFVRLELPLAAPGIINGARLTLVVNIGLTTIASLIGAGGLGSLIFMGLGQAAYDMVLLGSLTVVAMALMADLLTRILNPYSEK